MRYLKRNANLIILTFLIIIFTLTIYSFTFAKNEIYFSLYDDPEAVIIKNINAAEEFISIAMLYLWNK